MTEIVLIHGAWQGGWVWADLDQSEPRGGFVEPTSMIFMSF